MNGNLLPPNTPPPPRPAPGNDDWTPFHTRQQFKIADLLFRKVEMSAANVDELFAILGLTAACNTDDSQQSDEEGSTAAPFDSHKDMYDTVDASSLGDAPWNCLEVCYGDDVPDTAAPWKKKVYEVWYRDPDIVLRNLLDNPDFDGEFDYAPYVETVDLGSGGKRRWSNFMSANFAWRHCVSPLFLFRSSSLLFMLSHRHRFLRKTRNRITEQCTQQSSSEATRRQSQLRQGKLSTSTLR